MYDAENAVREAQELEHQVLKQVAQERRKRARGLRELLDADALPEQALQQLVENAPWLLAPQWTPLATNSSMESVRAQFKERYPERSDALLLNMARDSLWVVAVKRPGHHLTDEDVERATDTWGDLADFLDETTHLGGETSPTSSTRQRTSERSSRTARWPSSSTTSTGSATPVGACWK